jgi:hypothetical protein
VEKMRDAIAETVQRSEAQRLVLVDRIKVSLVRLPSSLLGDDAAQRPVGEFRGRHVQNPEAPANDSFQRTTADLKTAN